MMVRGDTFRLSVLVWTLAWVLLCQAQEEQITVLSDGTIAALGYNITGFENTTAYPPYGSYTDVTVPGTSSQIVEPQVALTTAPAGCNIFNQFGIANYSGPIPCETNTSAPCVNMSGKVVVVTGASTGIGRASADRFAAAGAIVVGTSRWPWRYPAPPNWSLYAMDQTSAESVKQMINRVAVTYGRIDVLMLNAGNQFLGDTANSDLRQMQLTFDTNFWGTVRVFQAALPLMPTSGYGRILLVTSIQSQVASPNYLPYTASKWALMAMQEEFYSTHAASGQTSNIDIVSLLPGTITTSLGYSATYGCPELVSTTAQSTLQTYLKPNALSAKAVGEGAYRLAIDPKPMLRNFIMSDTEWAKYMPVVCRRYSLPLEDFYQNVPGTPDITEWIQADAQSDAVYNCSIHCGREYCGSGPIWGLELKILRS
ncbi:hypothetical protein WJX82_005770 [Trebouxia sp. C0006]